MPMPGRYNGEISRGRARRAASASDSGCFMSRLAWIGPLLIVCVLPLAGRCGDLPRPADVLALQDLIQKTIERAEPSVACILVSRSDDYRHFETGRVEEGSG